MTERQTRILRLIHDHVEQHGYAVSVDELRPALELKSKSSVHRELLRMRDEGVVDWRPVDPRTLHLTAKGKEVINR